MNEPNDKEFPPPLRVGARVWSFGYTDHGPIDGPKIDIPAGIGGSIIGTEKPWMSMDSLLFVVKWDNGQISKHYGNGLNCIGRFETYDQFKRAIAFAGPIALTLGPQGGFRKAEVRVTFDGQEQEATVYDRDLWLGLLEGIARTHKIPIHETRVPAAARAKPALPMGYQMLTDREKKLVEKHIVERLIEEGKITLHEAKDAKSGRKRPKDSPPPKQ